MTPLDKLRKRRRWGEKTLMAEAVTDSFALSEIRASLALASRSGRLAATHTISRWLTRPSRGRSTRTPSDYGLSWEPLECRTGDAIRLVGWVVTPPIPRATVTLFHDIRNDRSQTLDRTASLVAAGYRCLAFDHRAHGESGGKRISFGYYESRDVIAAMKLIRGCWPEQPRLAWGIGMGAAAICYAASELCALAAVILEGIYDDIGSVLSSRIDNMPRWCRQLTQETTRATERRLGVRLDELDPLQYLTAMTPTRILIVPGLPSIRR
jgi:pimeloyl-ACP methyl ester carboxylesterase